MHTSRVRLRASQAFLLTARLLRSTTWQPALVVGLLGVALVHQALHGPRATPSSVAARLDVLAALLAGTAGFVLDDPSAATVAPAPTPRRVRFGVRVAWALGLVFLVAALTAAYGASGPQPIDPGRRAAELLVLSLAALAVAAVASRLTGDGSGGATGSAAPLVIVTGAEVLPADWWFWPPSGALPATATDEAGMVLLVGLAAAAVLVMASRDPASPIRLGFRRAGRRASGRGGRPACPWPRAVPARWRAGSPPGR